MSNVLVVKVVRAHRLVALLAMTIGFAVVTATELRDARAAAPTPQLPDLVADPPDNVSISVDEETPTKQRAEAKLLLRFNGYLHNKGPGALDFRGERSAPPDLADLSSPPMQVFQRIYEYETTSGPPPTSELTPHKNESSEAKMEYVEADGHNHWHLQHVASYSLWNAQKTALVAPSQKVGFCMEDSEHVENIGPEQGVYVDYGPHPREFCRQYQPEATEVFEGISEGWRDSYTANLAFQWVDVSNVLPGEYWLRADADPEHLIQQTSGEKPPAYAQHLTIVPGFDAESQSSNVEIDHPSTITLGAQRWEGLEPDEKPSATPSYTILTPPAHGTLGAISLGNVQYTPADGYTGSDSFTFSARDPGSSFPQSPAVATVSLNIGKKPSPSVAIEGAPASIVAGTSIELSAQVSNDTPLVSWSSSAGSITSTGATTAIYTAPPTPPPGYVTFLTAQSPGGGHDQRTIVIVAQTPAQPKPLAPGQPTPPGAGQHPVSRVPIGPLSSPGAMLIGRKLYLTATAKVTGRLRITALLHARRLGSCVALLRAHQSFTCTITLPRGVSVHAPISVWATLRTGGHSHQTVRKAAPVLALMKANATAALAGTSWRGVKQAWRFFCGMGQPRTQRTWPLSTPPMRFAGAQVVRMINTEQGA